jgi:hypothetical protein
MNPDDFEQKLQRQPMRPIPAEWRENILGAASRSGSLERASRNTQHAPWWRELFWPCPQAWAGLAAVWLVILALKFTSADKSEVVATRTPPPSPEMLTALREQQRALDQLIGPSNQPYAEPPRPSSARPRSQCPPAITVV